MSTAKTDRPVDVLVLGAHPSAYLAAALLAHQSDLRILHAPIPGESDPDRLVLVNPALFDLDPILTGMQKKLELEAVFGVIFLADKPPIRSEHRGKSPLSCVGSLKALRLAMFQVAESAGVELIKPAAATSLQIHRVNEKGLEISLGKLAMHPRALVLGGQLEPGQQKMLGMPDSWGADVLHRYTWCKLPGGKSGASAALGAKPIIPMSLNLGETLAWGWLLPGAGSLQLAIELPVEKLAECRPIAQLSHWARVLTDHGILQWKGEVAPATVRQIDMPMAGALAHEGVANRTLLIGPAGGFYAATGEDIYPNCWSALFAAQTLKKALTERHLQDALSPFRTHWRTTLGEHLRGPQQNLRFLLPLVYRNPVMTTRLCEAILLGKNVVR